MVQKQRILFVDDDPDFVAATQEVLESNGYEVITASDGASGFAMAVQMKPDLMLLDVMMNTTTEGFELSRKMKDTPELKDLPIIMMTGIRRAKNLAFGFEPDESWLPVKTLLEKPVPPARLLAEVAKYIRKPA